MRDELRHELAKKAAEGSAYPHLARFERQFSKVGLRVLEAVPVDHLRRALHEFEAWCATGRRRPSPTCARAWP